MMRFSKIVIICFVALLSGCGDDKPPVGPDGGVPYFEVEAVPDIINAGTQSKVSLLPILPIEFDAMDGDWVLFSDEPDSGSFSPPFTTIDLEATGYLYEPIWYAYEGGVVFDTVKINLYAYVVDNVGDTLAWNYAELKVIP